MYESFKWKQMKYLIAKEGNQNRQVAFEEE